MRLDLSVRGWVHTVACLLALALGAANLARPKGTRPHRRVGRLYLCAILVVGVTSLGIYGQNRFFFPHWLAIATLGLAAFAYAFAHFKWPVNLWLHGHLSSIVLTYYLLVAGGVNEAFLRVEVLRRLSGGFPSPLIGATHLVLQALTVLALIWLNLKYAKRRAPKTSLRQA